VVEGRVASDSFGALDRPLAGIQRRLAEGWQDVSADLIGTVQSNVTLPYACFMTSQRLPSDESLRLELQEAITTYRHQIVLLSQSLGITVTADSILLGYGFAQRLSSVLLVASLMPLAALFIYIQIATGLIPISYVAMRLEWKLSLREAPFIGTWARMRDDLPFSSLVNIGDLEDPKIRESMLHVPPWFFFRGVKTWILLLAFTLQLGLVLISLTVYHYRFM
jgi:hypothetical protein